MLVGSQEVLGSIPEQKKCVTFCLTKSDTFFLLLDLSEGFRGCLQTMLGTLRGLLVSSQGALGSMSEQKKCVTFVLTKSDTFVSALNG